MYSYIVEIAERDAQRAQEVLIDGFESIFGSMLEQTSSNTYETIEVDSDDEDDVQSVDTLVEEVESVLKDMDIEYEVREV